MDLQYKFVVNFLSSKVTETSRKGIEVLGNGLFELDVFILAITVREKVI